MKDYYPGYNEYSEIFLNLMMTGLEDEVDAASFWEAIDDETIFKFHYYFPDFPTRMTKQRYQEWFGNYNAPETAAEMNQLYKDVSSSEKTTIIMQYTVHYAQNIPDMNFLSIVTIKNRRVVGWEDYLDTAE